MSILLALLACLVGCAESQGDDDLDALESLSIVTDATFPPFHYLDDTGMPTGFDVELARRMAERAGFRPTVEVLPYAELHAGLLRGRHDLVAATTGVTPERALEYLFTEPYFETCQAALVRIGDGEPDSVVALAGRRVGASGSGTAARAMRSVEGAEHVSLDEEGVAPLANGTVDALIVDEFDAVEMARSSGGQFRVLSSPIAIESYAFVLPPERAALKRALDEALASLESDGGVAGLRERFGVERDSAWPVLLPGPR